MTTRTLRTLVLADEANVVASLRSVDRRTDWLALREYVANATRGRELIEFVLYVGLPPNVDAYEYPRQRQRKEAFLQWAEHNGFLVVRKDGSPTEDGRYKANVDVVMAIDAVDLALEMRPDVVVLMTGDADFAHLALTLRRRGIRVEVAALAQALGARLRAAANGVLDLAELLDQLPRLRDTLAAADRAAALLDE